MKTVAIIDNSITKERMVTEVRRSVSYPKEINDKLVKTSKASGITISVLVRHAIKVCDYSPLTFSFSTNPIQLNQDKDNDIDK
jgi:hypothetical protein